MIRRACTRAVPIGLLIPIVIALAATGAAADDKKAGKDREMARRLQVLQQEKTELGAKLKEMSDKSEELAKAAEQGKREADGKARELAAERRSRTELAAKLEKAEEDLRALKARHEETLATLARRENEKRALERVGAEHAVIIGRQARLVDAYRDRSNQLHGQAMELLEKLRVAEKRQADPFIGLAEVEAFNAYQDYRDKLDRLRVEPTETVR